MMPYLQFVPIYQERVWGGRSLQHELGRTLPGMAPIGESWEIVDRPEAQSVVAGGAWAGRTLRSLIAEHAAQVMGPRWPAERPFPILVKWLDCRDRLSLQVHPPAAVAPSLGGEPKTENWYFARTAPGASVLAGLKPGVSVDDFAAALQKGTAEQCVQRLPVQAGDSLFIRSGVMHAIEAGNVILEIQQNSDTTYRVYDWGRVGLDGKPRALHVRESLVSLAAAPAEAPRLIRASLQPSEVLVDCAEFRLTRRRVAPGGNMRFAAGEEPRIMSVVEGDARLDGAAMKDGANVLLPFAGDFTLTSEGGATVLVTDHFTPVHP